MSSPAVLAVIPARGGSKGVPRKNIRTVAGRPLIAYTIEAASQSRRVTYFVTSTDDPEISVVAQQFGSEVIVRPAEISQDESPMVPVVRHALAVTQATKGRFDYIVLLQPTTPLRTAAHIDAGIDLLLNSDAESLVSVYQVSDNHPARMYRQEGDRLIPYDAEPANRLRQQLAPVYHRNGCLYICRRELFDERGVLLDERPLPYIMSREDSINIDDEFDLAMADLMLRRRQEGKGLLWA